MTTATISAGDPHAPDAIVIGIVGDSISAGTPDWDPDPAVRATIAAPNEQSAWPYWAAQADPRLVFVVSAVDGERIDQILTRLDLVTDGVSALVVQGGINDIVQGRTPEQAAAGLRTLMERALSVGVPVAVPDILPWNRGYPDHEAPIRELNRRLRDIADELGVTVLAFHDTLEDPDRPGRMRGDWTVDLSHPSVAGHRRLGELAFRVPE